MDFFWKLLDDEKPQKQEFLVQIGVLVLGAVDLSSIVCFWLILTLPALFFTTNGVHWYVKNALSELKFSQNQPNI